MKLTNCYGRKQGVLLAMILSFVLSSERASAQLSSATYATNPHSSLALASNIEKLLKSRSLLDWKFYTESNLVNILGGNSVRWASNDSARIYATVLGFPGENIDVYWQDATNTNKRRSGGIVTGPMRLTATEIISVFGPEFKIEDPYQHDNPRHPTPLLSSTSDVGNKRYVYNEDDGKISSHVGVLFAGDGSVQRINVSQEMKE